MTSQSPRIYLYKITFEEVPYYYYGIHKEKKFGEYYMGSPKTNKWCWKLYTPKKQILQFFEFTDDGWLEANQIEQRIIRPFYNDDKWCLNENCGGVISFDILSKSGKLGGQKVYEEGKGIHARTKEEMVENGRKTGNKMYGEMKGIFAMSPEERSEISRKSGKKIYEEKKGCFSLTDEQKRERSKKSAKITNSQRWICTETGFITNSGNLSRYQKARGIDTSKRKRIS